jgi:16S rRNA processing protein RimM
MPADSFILGRLGAPRGIKGDLRLQSYSGEYEHIQAQKFLELRGQGRSLRLKVLRLSVYPDGATIAFDGYPTPETARALTGLEIVAPRSEAAPLGENEWYVADLMGLALVGPAGSELAGSELGRIISVVEGGPDPWLETALPDGRKVLVPFRKEFVGSVDVKAGRVELLAPWLLE